MTPTTHKHQRFPVYLIFSLLFVFLMLQPTPTKAATHPVSIYKFASQHVTSSTLVWETYDPKDTNQLKYAVDGGKYISEDENYPIYVCRVTIFGEPYNGHTVKVMQTHVCVAANRDQSKHKSFDVLVNKGHLGKVAWKRGKSTNGVPTGAIRIGNDAYIARRRATHQSHHEEGDKFNYGRLDPMGVGKIRVVENNLEKEYIDGEVLVETEPYRYELRDIKLDTIRWDKTPNITELAFGKLENTGEKHSQVATEISYPFYYMANWGLHEGVARGLPTKVFEKDAPRPTEINWGLKYTENRTETKNVQTKLWPGTAINVTLRGTYITLRSPYTAVLYAFYQGIEDHVSRKINGDVIKIFLTDIQLEFSPVYWIENGTFVPTTTTTTTTTTTSTTTHATTTLETKPLHEPPTGSVGLVHSGPDTLEKSLHDSPVSNEIPNDAVAENLAEKHQNHALAAVPGGGGSAAHKTQHWSICTALATLFAIVVSLNL